MRRGVTLAESILAVFLLSLIVVLIFNLYPASIASLRVSGQKLQADSVAGSILEDYMARSFTQLVVGPPQALPPVPGKGVTFQPEVEIFEVTQPADVDRTRIRGIRVTVRWSQNSRNHSVVREILRTNVRR
ncbi:MAG: hypothetical protein AB1758_22915 [Candidatus Eremiobacterota bacterium]